MEQKLRLSSEAAIRGHKKRLAQAEKRQGEFDRLFMHPTGCVRFRAVHPPRTGGIH